MPRKSKKYHYLYKTVNAITNKFYIGIHSTDDLNDGYLGSGKLIQRSIKKYGKENHVITILSFYSSREEVRQKEIEIVNEELLSNLLCLNLAPGGGDGRTAFGWKHTDEARKKISIGGLGRKWSDQQKEKFRSSTIGKKRSEQARQKMSLAKVGANFSYLERAVVVEGIEYCSIKEAAEKTGIKRTTIGSRINSSNLKFCETYYKDKPKTYEELH